MGTVSDCKKASKNEIYIISTENIITIRRSKTEKSETKKGKTRKQRHERIGRGASFLQQIKNHQGKAGKGLVPCLESAEGMMHRKGSAEENQG